LLGRDDFSIQLRKVAQICSVVSFLVSSFSQYVKERFFKVGSMNSEVRNI
jgi:hypothetical protein